MVTKVNIFQVIKNRFKEANLYTEQFITFTDQLAFKIAPSPTENWKIKSINSHVVSYTSLLIHICQSQNKLVR